MRRKRYTARQAEREVYALLKDLDGRGRALARLSPEDMPADLAHFAATVKTFRAQFGPFLERWEDNIVRRSFLRTATMMRNWLRDLDRYKQTGFTPPADIEEDEIRTRALLAQWETIEPTIKAALADNTAPHPVKTSELERMLRDVPKRKRR